MNIFLQCTKDQVKQLNQENSIDIKHFARPSYFFLLMVLLPVMNQYLSQERVNNIKSKDPFNLQWSFSILYSILVIFFMSYGGISSTQIIIANLITLSVLLFIGFIKSEKITKRPLSDILIYNASFFFIGSIAISYKMSLFAFFIGIFAFTLFLALSSNFQFVSSTRSKIMSFVEKHIHQENIEFMKYYKPHEEKVMIILMTYIAILLGNIAIFIAKSIISTVIYIALIMIALFFAGSYFKTNTSNLINNGNQMSTAASKIIGNTINKNFQ